MTIPARRGFQLLWLTLGAAAGVYARFVLAPLQETMRVALSLQDNQMALLQGPAVAVPLVLTAIPVGIIVDRYSRVRLLILLAVLNVIASALTAVASRFLLLLAARCLIGVTGGAISVAVYSLLGDLYSPGMRGRATMVVAFGEVAGSSAAFALGGSLIAIYGPGDGWRLAMLSLTVPLVLCALSTSALREPVRNDVLMKRLPMREAWTELWNYRAVITLLLCGRVIVGVADGAAFTWTAPALSRHFGLSADRVGSIMAVALLVSGVIGPIAGGFLADYCQRSGGHRRVLRAMARLAAISIPASVFALAPWAALSCVLLIVFIASGGATVVMTVAVTTIVIPNELRGLCLSVLMTGGVLFGVGFAPVAVSLLSGAIGGPAKIAEALTLVCVTAGSLVTVLFGLGLCRRSLICMAYPIDGKS